MSFGGKNGDESMRRFTAVSFVLLAALVVALSSCATVPPTALTHARMHVMKRRIIKFAVAHGSLPNSVEELPRMEGYDNGIIDAWGRPLSMRVEGDTVTLTSFGRDGVPGGTGDDTDMIGIFLAKTVTGQWAAELCEWELDPYGRQRK